MLLVVTGARGAGKTTLVSYVSKHQGIDVLKPSTTRARRSETDDEYDFVTEWDDEIYSWSIPVGEHTYGMRKTEIERCKSSLAITVFDPLNIDTLREFEKNAPFEVVLIGLDTIETIREQHSRVCESASRKMTSKDFVKAVEETQKADLVLRGDEDTIAEATISAIELLSSRGGVLSKRHLTPLIKAGALLVGAERCEGLQSASYDLSIGTQVWCKGQLLELTDDKPTFDIPAYSYAIVIANEEAWLPTFISGSFDIKVGLFLRGMILSNGPQVDPGYRGPLFCMLFNGSSDSKTLARYTHFSTIEFKTVTHKAPAYSDRYQLQPRLEAIMAEGGLSGQGGNIMEQFEDKYKRTNARLDNTVYASIATVGTVVALLIAHAYWVDGEVDDVGKLGAKFEYATELHEKLRSNHEDAIAKEIELVKAQLTSTAAQLNAASGLHDASRQHFKTRLLALEEKLAELTLALKLQKDNGE